jgi:hypothetical protein
MEMRNGDILLFYVTLRRTRRAGYHRGWQLLLLALSGANSRVSGGSVTRLH